MTGSGSGAPDRNMLAAHTSWRGIGRQILIVMAIGLVFRLIMAYGIDGLRGSGFDSDLKLFRYWASNLGQQGPFGFYDRGFFADYTPGYLYALWLVGLVGQVAGGVGDLIKLPAIVTDIALGLVVYRMALDLGTTERRATIAAAVVIFNPISWFDSTIWGQVDSFGTVFLLLAIRELWRGRSERSAILAVVAALIKPQLGILVPILALVVIRRAVWPSGGWGDDPAPEPSGTAWERRTTGPIRILTTAVAGFLTAVLVSAPFGLSVVSFSTTAPFVDSALVRLVLSTAATYSFVTVNAYNAWALFPVDGVSLASSGSTQWIPDAPVPDAATWAQIGGLPAALVGALLLVAVILVTSFLVARRPDRLTILVGVSVLALAFFAVPTRVHERYLFPLFGLAGILIAFSWRWRIAYAVAGVATFLNMYVVLTTVYPGNPGIADWLGIGDAVRSFWGVAILAAMHTAVLVWGIAQLRPAARRRLAAERVRGSIDDLTPAYAAPDPTASPDPTAVAPARTTIPPGPVSIAMAAPGPPAVPHAPAAAGSVPEPAADPVPAQPRRRLPAWYDRPSLSDLGLVGWFRARVNETPIRPDRSHQLAREGRGRLDRLDIWILVVIVAAAMGLRMFRLAEPVRMHFDEVYHARTAAEFLQDWRYGIEHPIYEWTHPHLAKYAIAAGIVLFAGHDVEATSQLDVKVRDVAIEPMRPDLLATGDRAGDRVWVATGDELVGYDLRTRAVAARWSVPGASAVAFDPDGLQLLVGTDAGQVLALDVSSLDDLGGFDATAPPVSPTPIATLDGSIRRLATFDGGQAIAALLSGDTVAVVDGGTGTESGRLVLPGAADMLAAGQSDAVVATPVDVTDAPAEAAELASILGGDAADYAPGLTQLDADTVTLPGTLTPEVRSSLQAAIDGGQLAGIRIDKVPVLAVADTAGVDLVTTRGTLAATIALKGPATSVAYVTGVEDGTQLYATSTDAAIGQPQVAIVAMSGDSAKDGPRMTATMQMPGATSRIVYDEAAGLVDALGVTPDGSPTVYVIEPHGKTVFADHRLPFDAAAWVLDSNPDYPTDSHGAILVFAADGATGSLNVDDYAFAWRLPGVILGALTAGLLYLLTRVLFRRREVGVLVGLFAILDGMFFVQSRIAMNDVYVGVFILAAYVLFAWLWLQPARRRWSFWAAMPAIGVLLGLALASKWVAAYAIGALGILILARSALGRVLLILGLIGLTGVLGWMALAVPTGSDASGNVTFALLMIGLTLAAVAISAYHPIAWSDDEIRLAVGGPPALGILLALSSIALGRADTAIAIGPVLVTPISTAFVLVVTGLVAYAAFQVSGRLGFGPMAPVPPAGAIAGIPPASPPAEGWLRLGSGLGLPIVWMLGSLLVIPIVVYVISYLPWAAIEGHQIMPGWPPGHTGQTLLDLTGEMYRYHNNLTAAHPASSPWWAWPLNLKPVWFYQGGFAESTAASIYDAGNLVVWWLGVPALVFVTYQAFRRRSLALGLIVIGFLCQWVSWARIDRAAFEYHYYTSLPFVIMALAYFVAELWHGASRRTWLLARVAAAAALLGPVILWVLRLPLCTFAGVDSVNEGSAACHGNPGNLVITPAAAAMAIIVLVTLVILVRQLVDLGRPRADGRPLDGRDLVPLLATAVIGGALLALSRVLPSTDALLNFPGIVPELIALVIAVPLALVAIQVVTARDARRFVIGLVSAVAIWFVILYPNISALPLPATVVNAYQGLLPTYLYAFQFSVNTIDRSGSISFADPRFVLLLAFIAIASVVVAYSAWIWRQSLADEPADQAPDPVAGGPAGEPGST